MAARLKMRLSLICIDEEPLSQLIARWLSPGVDETGRGEQSTAQEVLGVDSPRKRKEEAPAHRLYVLLKWFTIEPLLNSNKSALNVVLIADEQQPLIGWAALVTPFE